MQWQIRCYGLLAVNLQLYRSLQVKSALDPCVDDNLGLVEDSIQRKEDDEADCGYIATFSVQCNQFSFYLPILLVCLKMMT